MSGEEQAKPARTPRSFIIGTDFSQGEWYEIGDARIQVRHVPPRRVRELRVQAGLPAYPAPKEQLTDEQRVAFNAATLDETIQAWEGFVGPDGEPLPCELRYKLAALEEHAMLAPWLQERSARVWMSRALTEAKSLGNSQGSSTGDPSTPGTSAPDAPSRGAGATETT